MTTRKSQNANKMLVLERILENKELLLGQFSSTVSHITKERAWADILEVAQSVGLAGHARDWTFARDKLWGSWKSRTMRKRDNARATGTGGGKEAIMDEVDAKILDILCKDSPAVDGLMNIPESYGPPPSTSPAQLTTQNSAPPTNTPHHPDHPALIYTHYTHNTSPAPLYTHNTAPPTHSTVQQTSTHTHTTATQSRKRKLSPDYTQELKIRWQELQNKKAEEYIFWHPPPLKRRWFELQNMKMEMELGITSILPKKTPQLTSRKR
uniref:Regulatory protein zeste n=1 Tax=Cacopsylla melanoneura TaxID=428564 RepID=A0A8D8ZXA8_9HEMI